jgi:ribosome recycling factor
MEHEVIKHTKDTMAAAITHLKQELRAIRAGRASPALVEGILVEVYGSNMRLKEVASILMPEARQLLINPYDASNTQAVARAIEKSDLGVRAIVEGKGVRVQFPELDQNRRKDLVNQVHKKKEETKVAIRSIRRDANEKIKDLKTKGELPEDDMKRMEKHIQEMTDHSCREADEAAIAKEKEVMTV